MEDFASRRNLPKLFQIETKRGLKIPRDTIAKKYSVRASAMPLDRKARIELIKASIPRGRRGKR